MRRSRASRTSDWMTTARRATSAWRPRGFNWRRSSLVRSWSRTRFACIDSSFRRAFSLRLRCLRTPAASSMMPRRSSGVASRIAVRRFWPTMTCISRPMPESLRSSWTSSNRAVSPLMAYSDPPLRNRVREMVTSAYSMGSLPSELSMVTETSARPSGALPAVPEKMTSSIFPPRRDFAPCSPMTHARASTTLDLPEPFGPTTQVTPGSRCRVVEEAKDLKPFRVNVFRCTVLRWSVGDALRRLVRTCAAYREAKGPGSVTISAGSAGKRRLSDS
ncbi:unannotated protein [freshwater metagenome]|uniref:Unannotated protein n=1 Tax=freshwater metagenome TaxID=449393 RepID=A0A6J7INS5_9ZZZZ